MPGADRTENAPQHGRAEEQHASPRSPAGGVLPYFKSKR